LDGCRLNIKLKEPDFSSDSISSLMAEDSVDELILQLERLRVQEDALLRQIVQARARESQERQENSTGADSEAASYRIGDRVRVTNQSRGILGRQATERDRVGTVIKITKKRVFLRTDNGTSTNRAPENLRRI
jgi:hypothetical protein